MQDGIVARFLADHCPSTRFRLCKERKRLPDTVEDFLWQGGAKGVFVKLGGFDDYHGEMAAISRASLLLYPGQHLATALISTGRQLVRVGTGDGIVHHVWDAYGAIERLVPAAVPAAHTARQRFGQLPFEQLNRLHKPIAWASIAILPLLLLLVWRRRDLADLAMLTATIGTALMANAFVCGVLSNPVDRYGARLVWIATFLLVIAIARLAPAVTRSNRWILEPRLLLWPGKLSPA